MLSLVTAADTCCCCSCQFWMAIRTAPLSHQVRVSSAAPLSPLPVLWSLSQPSAFLYGLIGCQICSWRARCSYQFGHMPIVLSIWAHAIILSFHTCSLLCLSQSYDLQILYPLGFLPRHHLSNSWLAANFMFTSTDFSPSFVLHMLNPLPAFSSHVTHSIQCEWPTFFSGEVTLVYSRWKPETEWKLGIQNGVWGIFPISRGYPGCNSGQHYRLIYMITEINHTCRCPMGAASFVLDSSPGQKGLLG